MAAMAYFGEQLGMSTEIRYEVLSHDTHKAWNWNRGEDKGNSYATTSPDLARALRRNAHLKVFVASGRYDLGTPYSASDWSLAQLDAPADVLARVKHHYYDAGHMMYTRQADLTQLKADLAAWLAEPLPRPALLRQARAPDRAAGRSAATLQSRLTAPRLRMADLSAFPITRKWPARHPDRIQLYSLPTPNGVKVSIMLEETGLPTRRIASRSTATSRSRPSSRRSIPNGKIPAIIDPERARRQAARAVRVGRDPALSRRQGRAASSRPMRRAATRRSSG